MSARAYVLLDIADGNSDDAVKMLRSWPGVVFADRLEGNPDVIVMVQAATRQKLAQALMPVIGCVDTATWDMHLMVTQDNQPLSDIKNWGISRPRK